MAKTELTPMQKQYQAIKEQNPDTILFFRLGDFYEMFNEDAVLASKALDLALTTRDRGKPKEEQTPMCGVPYHAAETYIARLVGKGYKVAVCEQMEDPALAKGIVVRDVTRIITPGTVTESSMLEEGKNNYICCIYTERNAVGLAFCDISTGEFCATQCDEVYAALAELSRWQPAEVLCYGPNRNHPALQLYLRRKLKCCITEPRDKVFHDVMTTYFLQEHFGKSLDELGLPGPNEAANACANLLYYLRLVQKSALPNIHGIAYYTSTRFMELDPDTRRNLELTQTMRSGEKRGSLLWVLDKTLTPMGGRMLRGWIEKPLMDVADIVRRQDAVEELVRRTVHRAGLQEELKSMTDLERVMTRITNATAGGRDLLVLAQGLHALPKLKTRLNGCKAPIFEKLAAQIDPLKEWAKRIDKTIVDDPPVSVREGKLIRAGADPEVDRLRDILNGGEGTLLAIEAEEKEKTGIRTLKVGYNRVFGYYIEVSKSFIGQVPAHYIRRQTLAGSERYITPELKALEEQVLTAKDRLAALEYEIFARLREELAALSAQVQLSASAVATADALCSLAEVAVQYHYCRPEIVPDRRLHIIDGRHPVVERTLTDALFVPNDTLMAGEYTTSVITGPNMAGKSTYMRQVALIVLMAQIGSFVPAKTALIGVVDRIFTRIGASDDLSSGQSTFMVEMTEMSNILRHATGQSLLILDEIGRGTSTYDGMAIAQAVLEYLTRLDSINARTLFATHYHELSVLEGRIPATKSYNIAVKKRGDDMIFLRKIVPGATDDSFGVEVAQLAGLPKWVVKRAREILEALKKQDAVRIPDSPDFFQTEKEPAPEPQVSMADLTAAQVCEALKALNLDTITPIEAMNELFRLKKMLAE